jgi:hypothetical protein
MTHEKPSAKGQASDDDPLKERMKANPGGTAIGAAAGAVAGGVAGLGGGPAGAALGAAAGAAYGALRGSGARGSRDVTVAKEDAHWREAYASRSYASPGARYEDFGPAYRHAVAEWLRHDGQRTWDDARADLEAGWDAARERSSLGWKEAEPAARDALRRLDEVARPGSGNFSA